MNETAKNMLIAGTIFTLATVVVVQRAQIKAYKRGFGLYKSYTHITDEIINHYTKTFGESTLPTKLVTDLNSFAILMKNEVI